MSHPAWELELRGWEALAPSPAAARTFYESVLADDVVMLFPGMEFPVSGRDDVLASMSGPRWTSWSVNGRVHELAEDAVVAIYGVTATREGSADPYRALVSSTYRRRADGGWELVLHQQTPR